MVVKNGSLIEFDSQKYFNIVKGNAQDKNFNLVFSKPLSFNNSEVASKDNVSTPNKFRNNVADLDNFQVGSNLCKTEFSMYSG